MITGYMGTKFEGSSTLETSVANEEILNANTTYANLTFIVDTACTIKINGGDAIYIRASQTILIPVCSSLKIVESGIKFSWLGCVK